MCLSVYVCLCVCVRLSACVCVRVCARACWSEQRATGGKATLLHASEKSLGRDPSVSCWAVAGAAAVKSMSTGTGCSEMAPSSLKS